MPTRRSLVETRERVLAAGLELLTEDDFSSESPEVSLIDACRRAGLGTAGSGYKIWPTQADFVVDLWRYAVNRRDEIRARVAQLSQATDLVEAYPDRTELIRMGSADNAEAVTDIATVVRQTALWLAAERDTEVRKGYVEAQRELIDALAGAYLGIMETYGMEMRPPFTAEMMAVAVESATRGFASVSAFSDDFGISDVRRPTGADGEMQHWHLLGCVTEAIVEAFTRPKDAGTTKG